MDPLKAQIQTLLDKNVKEIRPLHGGMIADVYKVLLADNSTLVAKTDHRPEAKLNIEGNMLIYLKAHSNLPVPEIRYNSRALLIMEFIEGTSHFDRAEEEHAAELLADLHRISAPQFGFDEDTRAGNVDQFNPWNNSWIEFFRDNRLIRMSKQAFEAGRLPSSFLSRIERLSQNLENWLVEPEQSSLVHGDVWTTNVLAKDGRITGFLDPATYYGHHEIELAFIALFNTFGSAFFNRYQEIYPIHPGFFEERVHIYNLYPLLVHVWHFGEGYIAPVDQTLVRFGY